MLQLLLLLLLIPLLLRLLLLMLQLLLLGQCGCSWERSPEDRPVLRLKLKLRQGRHCGAGGGSFHARSRTQWSSRGSAGGVRSETIRAPQGCPRWRGRLAQAAAGVSLGCSTGLSKAVGGGFSMEKCGPQICEQQDHHYPGAQRRAALPKDAVPFA